MSFLYGQIDHYILDVIMHPLIYYMTEDMPKNNFLSQELKGQAKYGNHTAENFTNDIFS